MSDRPSAAHARPINRAQHQRWAHLLEASEGAAVGRDLPRRSLAFDALIAIVFVALGYLLLQVLSPKADTDDAVFVLLINLPLIVRRRFPLLSFVVIVVCGLVQMVLDIPIGLYDAGLLFSLYSVVGYTGRRISFIALGAGAVLVVVGAATDWWLYVDQQLAEPSRLVRSLSALGAAGLVAAAWALGERLRSGRTGVLTLTERAETLEREREQQALIVAAAERARIAREMHDVIAHGLSVMIVQADGAAYVVEQSPAVGRAALEQISATGRESLSQMRSLLGLLRAGADSTGPEGTVPSGPSGPSGPGGPGGPGDDGADQGRAGEVQLPQPSLDDIPELIAEAEQAGARVRFSEDGRRRAIPQMVALTAYRVVQEGLTNARKHGGPDIELIMTYRRDGLSLVIKNEAAESGAPTLTSEPGHGLLGMAERVAAVGGELTVGPKEPSGFQITAWLPDQRVGR